MRILPCNSYNFKGFIKKTLPCPADKNLQEGRISKGGKIFNRHTTTYFRSDLDWEELGTYLKNKFADSKEVQSLIWGCSRGQEAYSLAILLKRYFGHDFKKFLPIKAMDIDSRIIESNKRDKEDGFILDGSFIEKMQNGLNIRSLRFDLGEIGKYCKLAGYSKYQFKNYIMDSVEFEESNILNDLDKIQPDKPALIMFRNMWPYINSDEYSKYASELYNKLPKGSVVIVGEYDWRGDACVQNSSYFPKTLMSCGFKPANDAGVQNSIFVFEK